MVPLDTSGFWLDAEKPICKPNLKFWRRIKGFKSQENFRRVDEEHIDTSYASRIQKKSVRTSASQNFKDSIAKSVRPKQSKHSLFHSFHNPLGISDTDSGYSSVKGSLEETAFRTIYDRPSIPKFSWEDPIPLFGDSFAHIDSPLSPTHFSHVEAGTPSWEHPLNQFCNCAAHIYAREPEVPPPVPPKDRVKASTPIPSFSRPLQRTMPDRPSSKRLSDSHSRSSKKRDSGPASSSRLSTQSSQSARLSTQSTHLPPQRPESQISPVSPRPSPHLGSDEFANVPRPTTASSFDTPIAGFNSAANNSSNNLGGLVCNVHRTTGSEPPALVGASTSVIGDKLYVFGGRRLSQRTSQLTRTLYELDLVRRHWTKLETRGHAPIPRYFHSMCSLGDSKLVCYGGMAQLPDGIQRSEQTEEESNMTVMSDIHILDVATLTWTKLPTTNTPPGRYAHCATILPSSGVFTSTTAAQSALQHNPDSGQSNQGSIGVSIDGRGGAEMVVVGGQDSSSHYIEQISVFNFRNFKWSTPTPFSRNFGAYRSVVTSLVGIRASDIGSQQRPDEVPLQDDSRRLAAEDDDNDEDNLSASGAPTLLYSNYNFLDVKLELQIRLRNGTVMEKAMQGSQYPPGLRFPNGGIVAGHFMVSGTFLTSTKQEYNLWALNLRTLEWNRVEVGGNLSSGSWNRGSVWAKRNAYVVLGNRKRSLGDDYNHRRLNFTHLCTVELEAFGLYDNPSYLSKGAAAMADAGSERHAHSLGLNVLTQRDLTDMDILSLTGERIPVNMKLVAHGWGPYFEQLLREADDESLSSRSDTQRDSLAGSATLRPFHPSRSSSLTIVTSLHSNSGVSSSTTSKSKRFSEQTLTPSSPSVNGDSNHDSSQPYTQPSSTPPTRLLYLPHAPNTIRALLHYLYTSTLPPAHHPLSTPQVLCSLLQLARPYHVPGLLEATVQRLHQVLDAKSAAAIFNAAAMAAGGGEAVRAVVGGLRVGVDRERHMLGGSKLKPMPQAVTNAPVIASANTSFASSKDASDTDADTSASEADTANRRINANGGSASARSGPGTRAAPRPAANQSFTESENSTEDEGQTDEEPGTNLSSANVSFTGEASASATDNDTDTDATSTDATTTDASASEDGEDGRGAAARQRGQDNASRGAAGTATNTARNTSAIATSGTAVPAHQHHRDREKIWRGTWSPVVGLQKRSLRGLVEGRRSRDDGADRSSTMGSGSRGSVGSVGSLGSLGSIVEAANGGGGGEDGDERMGGRRGNVGLGLGD